MRKWRTASALAALLAGLTAASQAEPQAAKKPLVFDAASVKPAASNGAPGMPTGRTGGSATADHPGRIHYPAITLKSLLINAYGVKDFQIQGPGWLDTERFQIDATMPPETTKAQLRVMVQNLLADRFKLTLHRETKELPVYSLAVAKLRMGPR